MISMSISYFAEDDCKMVSDSGGWPSSNDLWEYWIGRSRTELRLLEIQASSLMASGRWMEAALMTPEILIKASILEKVLERFGRESSPIWSIFGGKPSNMMTFRFDDHKPKSIN